MKLHRTVWRALALALALGLHPGPDVHPVVGQTPQENENAKSRDKASVALFVPAYFYPSGSGTKAWAKLGEAARRVPVIAIANVDSGPGAPGTPTDATYVKTIREASAANVTIVAYISTRYGKQPMAEIKRDIDRWIQDHPTIRGFFLDEMASDPGKVAWYREVADYGRLKLKDALIVGNPGTTCDEAYFAQNAVDTACLYENDRGFERWKAPKWASRYPSRRFSVLPHTIADAGGMVRAVRHAVQQRAGWIYVTDDRMPNPWDRLPSYWDALVQEVARINAGGK